MPHVPDSHHDTHDLELVAAFAAGDAAGDRLHAASTLVASCADCAALHHDLRAIAAAMPALPVPARSRDFRLTPEQAAALRPAGWRRLLAAFASPRLSFTAPLGTGLAALGLVGVLVASGGLPLGGASQGTALEEREEAASIAITMDSPAYGPPSMAAGDASAAPVQSTSPIDRAAGDTAGGGEGAASAGPAGQVPEGPPDVGPAASDEVDTLGRSDAADGPSADAAGAPDAAAAPDRAMLLAAAAALLVGVALVVLRWTARRIV